MAAAIGYPVALKIVSPDISHKSDVGGVALDLVTPQDLERAGQEMLGRCRELHREARIEGFTVPKMICRGGAHELLAGVRGHAAVDKAALESTLIKLAQLAIDVAEIAELDINPLLADEQGVIALDARVCVAPSPVGAIARLAIRPYPSELEEEVEHSGRRLVLRPIRPKDTPHHREFLARTSPQDRYTRCFNSVRELPAADLAHLTQIDYDREMAFIAVAQGEGGGEEILGVARACADPDSVAAEFAVMVLGPQAAGAGRLLMQKLMRYSREHGTQRLCGSVLTEDAAMLHLSRSLGFRVRAIEANVEEIELELQPGQAAASA